ncbi:MAG TPA: hypothetical protein VHM90_02080 [Phycisphaerae bacterium]|nr:hypothetical protein [Phycisphaerae bacterium]
MTSLSTAPAYPPANSPAAVTTPVPAAVPFATVFRALLRKEPRELALPAVIIGGFYGILLAYALFLTYSDLYGPRATHSIFSALSELFLGATVLVGPLAGLIVGFVQFIVEARPARYGLLIHRPASRSAIFAAKTIIGIAAYLLAMLVPLWLALMWASNPANLPLPFTWNMALAPVADVLSGIPFYFAGVLVAQRADARWYGSRLVPVAGLVLAVLGNVAAPHFGWSVLWTMVAAIVTCIAARAYFIAAGQYERVARHARPALGLLLVLGVLTAGAAAVGLLDEMTRRPVSATWASEIGYLRENGRPVIHDRYGGGGSLELDGKPIAEGKRPLLVSSVESLDTAHSLQFNRQIHGTYSYFMYEGVSPTEQWYRAMPAGGGNYLVGFDTRQRIRLGAVGASGFAPGAAVPATPFETPMLVIGGLMARTDPKKPGQWGTSALITAGDSAWRFFDSHSLLKVFTTAQHEPIIAAGRLNVSDVEQTRSDEHYSVLQTIREVIVLTDDDAVFLRYPVPELEKYNVRTLGVATTGQKILQFDPHTDLRGATPPRFAAYFNADGSFDHKVDLPWTGSKYETPAASFVETVATPLVPAGAVGLMSAITWLTGESMPPDAGVIVPWSVAGGCLSAAMAAWLARRGREGWGVALAWGAVGLVAGVGGVVAMLAQRGVPRMVACPGCGRRRPVASERCGACGAAFTGPAANGSEIFGARAE